MVCKENQKKGHSCLPHYFVTEVIIKHVSLCPVEMASKPNLRCDSKAWLWGIACTTALPAEC